MLGLAEQVGGDVRRVGGLVGEDQDLGGPGLGVDADPALEQPLGGDRPDRARPGHQVDPGAGADAVGEHRDRLGAADGVDLLDAEQRARGQDRRVRQAAVLLLRGRGQRDRADAGDLGRDDVHEHAGDQRRDAAGHVEADPVDRHLAVGDPGAGAELGGRVPLQLGLAGGPQPADRLLQPGPDVRVEAAPAPPAAPPARTRMSVWVTPSYCSDISRIASSPRVRTASQIACTAGIAASTSKSARGTASR